MSTSPFNNVEDTRIKEKEVRVRDYSSEFSRIITKYRTLTQYKYG